MTTTTTTPPSTWEPPASIAKPDLVRLSDTVLAMPDRPITVREDIFRIHSLGLDWDIGGEVFEPVDPAHGLRSPDGRPMGYFSLHGGAGDHRTRRTAASLLASKFGFKVVTMTYPGRLNFDDPRRDWPGETINSDGTTRTPIYQIGERITPDQYELIQDRSDPEKHSKWGTLFFIRGLLSQHRDELERGVRFLFWSGHSHGRYAGSCWYVDHFWQELYDRAVVGMSVDSPGGIGATGLGGAKVMDEALGVMRRAVDVIFPNAKAAAKRPEGGEQPLWRVGVPSLNPLRGRQEKGSPTLMVFEPASGWWHHARADTVDKIDPQVLRRDAQVHLLSLWTIVTEPVLPFDYGETARGVLQHLEGLPRVAKVDLSDLVALTQRLERAATALHDSTVDPGALSDAIRRMGRALIPALYTLEGPWDPDPTLNKGFLPGLADVRRLAEIDVESDEAYLLRTRLVRQRNRIAFALRRAAEIAEQAA